MNTPEHVPSRDVDPFARTLPPPSQLAAALRDQHRPKPFGELIARHLRFLRVAAHRTMPQTVRIWTLVAARDRDPVRADIAAMCRVVRVRMCLSPEHQRAFDQIIADYPRIMLGLFVDRSDAEALEAVQRHLASIALTMPAAMPEPPASVT